MSAHRHPTKPGSESYASCSPCDGSTGERPGEIQPAITFGSLFAGIGGLDLGLERAGMNCVWQVEKDEYATRVLEKHWPDVRRWDDVRTFPPAGDWRCDLICGGFPCQPVSLAGQGKAQSDSRWLWPEFARVLDILRPRFAVIENVPGLLFRGATDVLCDLAALGFDAEWDILSARQCGAPHQRDRLCVVAYRRGERLASDGCLARSTLEAPGQEQGKRIRLWPGLRKPSGAVPARFRWVPNRELCRVVDGVPDELERYQGLGNAVVPQVAEEIGRRILDAANPLGVGDAGQSKRTGFECTYGYEGLSRSDCRRIMRRQSKKTAARERD